MPETRSDSLRPVPSPVGKHDSSYRLFFSHADEVQQVLRSLIRWLASPEQESLRRAFPVWLNRVLWPSRFGGLEVPQTSRLDEVEAHGEALLDFRGVDDLRGWLEGQG